VKEDTNSSIEDSTILVIVYEHIVRDMLARILKTKAHKVVTCSLGRRGIRMFEKMKRKFDLVIIDTRLPDVSGFGLSKKIKRISRKTPVILIKARELELEPGKARESGADVIMSRPFYMDKTLDFVERVMVTNQSAQG